MQGQTKKYAFCFAPFRFLAKEKGRFFEAGVANPCQLLNPACNFAIMFGVY
jgi:hypothetical protein